MTEILVYAWLGSAGLGVVCLILSRWFQTFKGASNVLFVLAFVVGLLIVFTAPPVSLK